MREWAAVLQEEEEEEEEEEGDPWVGRSAEGTHDTVCRDSCFETKV